MDEEIEMQREWRDDENKCTFIVLARDAVPGGDSDVPPPPAESGGSATGGEGESYPRLVERTLDAMIGDVNLFLSEEESEESEESDGGRAGRIATSAAAPKQAELDLMIAAASHRHKNLGAELALAMMHYGAEHLRIRRFFVKIKETINSSLKLFKEKLGFAQCAYAECFGKSELECKCKTPEEMTAWVERRWQWWCRQKKKNDVVAEDGEGCNGNGDGQHRGPCRMYDVYECPLNSSA